MDLESCGGGSFYDEIASLMPSPDDYELSDIDEILRSTDSHLDSSFDLASFSPHNQHENDYGYFVGRDSQNESFFPSQFQEDFNFGPSIPEACKQSKESIRTSSTSSMDDDSFNPNDFMSFLNEEDIKMEFISDAETPQRNTPSPTGSCSSSGGSSTSGIQSDASSETQIALDANISTHSECSATEWVNQTDKLSPICNVPASSNSIPQTADFPTITRTIGTPISISMSALTVPQNTTNSTALQPLTQVQQISVLSGSLIPMKTVSLVTSTTPPTTDIKAPAPTKIEPKLAPKTGPAAANVKTKTTLESNTANVAKVPQPSNSKPKTVFLSFNDYKTLTQMNNKGGKIAAGQSPKIILKTANGKVITANKVISTGSIQHAAHNFAPKFVKTNNNALLLKQQSKGAGVVAAKAGNLVNTLTSGNSHLNMYKGIIDEKMWKKQQRMIKNRESASLSRKKKKEYVVTLETRISNLEKENCTLRGENSSLRSQLVALAQSCHCNNSNISEFVLNSLNINQGDQHVKIAPKPSGKSTKQRMSAATLRKNIALLFAMAFMVSLNVGNFQSYLNKNSIENSIESASQSDEGQAAGRRLLWVETENEFKQNAVNKKPDGEMDVPPLHFLHPVNRTKAMTVERNRNVTIKHLPLSPTPSKCTTGANFTEYQRLHTNLHKWIDGNDYLNLSLYDRSDNGFDKGLRFKKLTSSYFEKKVFEIPLQKSEQQMKRKLFIPGPIFDSKKRKTDGTQIFNKNGNNQGNEIKAESEKNSLDIFKPKISEEYLRLFKGIKRQDDTFYVLSFNMDHILLPASAYNKSARPKMSLMLPAGDPSLNGDVVLMQIDCEVVNTTELELKSYMIPEKLRPQKYGHGSFHATPNPNDVVNNETHSHGPPQRKEKVSLPPEMPKQKAPPTTYYMMGPRSAAAAAAMKKKPTLIRLGSNESIENIASHGENSTLFP